MRWLWILLASMIVASPFLLKFVNFSSDSVEQSLPRLQWRDLRQYSGEPNTPVPELLSQFSGAQVEMAGFVVPLADDLENIDEFILVPSAMACIHVPPPPPNQIVHVRLRKSVPTHRLLRPQFIRGVFQIQKTESVYGGALYLIDNASAEPYQRNRGF